MAAKWAVPPLATATVVAGLAAVDPIVAASAISAVGAVLGSWLAWRQKRSENRIEAQAQDTDAMSRLVGQLQTQLEGEFARAGTVRTVLADQQREIATLKQDNTHLRVGIIKLLAQLEHHEIEPVWRPIG